MKNSRVAQRLGFGFENEEERMEGDVILNGDETVEGELLEVAEAQEEVDIEEEAIAELEEAADGLGEVAEEVEASMEDGGLDPRAARFMQLATQSYTARLGAQAPIVSSMESFGGSSGKLNSTQVSLEGLKEFVITIWEKIIQLWNSLIAKVKNLWLKLFDAAPKLAKRAEALKEAASNTTGTAKEAKINGPLKALHIGGRAPDLVKAAATLEAEAKNKDASKTAIEIAEEAVKNLETVAATPEKIDEINKADGKIAKVIAKVVKGGTVVDGRTTAYSAELPGGVKSYTSVKSEGTAGELMASLRSGMQDADPKKQVEATGEFATLTPSQVETICGHIIKMAHGIADYKKDWENQQKAVDGLKAAGDKVTKSTKGDDLTSEQKSAITSFVRGAGNSGSYVVKANSTLNAYCLKTGRVMLSVCEKSLAQYK